ncbi:MAG: molecular chaperone DnaJ [Alphaproteobacteria bacterium]
MAKADYYQTLGVAKGASSDELKKAYRKMAMQYHPDRNQGDQEAEKKFKEINEAYDVLRDDQKRAAYDRFGHQAFENGGRGADAGFGGANFSDIFEEMFGEMMGGGRRRGAEANRRGSDLRYDMDITLEDAFRGKATSIRIPNWIGCTDCEGTGSAGKAAPANCSACGGAGRQRMQQGFFTVERGCATCQGSGKIIKDPCRSCSGQGRVRKEKNLEVNIPAGVEDGTRLRVAGEGEAGMRGGPNGDLYVFIGLKPHRLFQREGANLLCRVPVPMVKAALGGEIEIPTIDGTMTNINLPAGTQTGQQFRVRGRGMSVLKSNARGDLYVDIQVETPVNLTKRQQELLHEFAHGEEADNISPESSNFFSRVKEFWNDLKD